MVDKVSRRISNCKIFAFKSSSNSISFDRSSFPLLSSTILKSQQYDVSDSSRLISGFPNLSLLPVDCMPIFLSMLNDIVLDDSRNLNLSIPNDVSLLLL